MRHLTPRLIIVTTTMRALMVGLPANTLAAEHTSHDGEPAAPAGTLAPPPVRVGAHR